VETNKRLLKEAEASGPTTCHCFAGLCATAVPVKLGACGDRVSQNRARCFTDNPPKKQFEKLVGAIGRKTLGVTARERLREAYFQTKSY
jgi:hypothetical protein